MGTPCKTEAALQFEQHLKQEEKARLARPFRAILQALSFGRGLDAEFAEALQKREDFFSFLADD